MNSSIKPGCLWPGSKSFCKISVYNRVRKLLTIVLFLTLVIQLEIPVFAQSGVKSNGELNALLLEKSRKQRNTGTILLATSFSCTITVPVIWSISTQNGSGFRAITAVYLAGLICLPVSIGFFIAGSINKKRAIRTGLTLQTLPETLQRKFENRLQPAMTLKISL